MLFLFQILLNMSSSHTLLEKPTRFLPSQQPVAHPAHLPTILYQKKKLIAAHLQLVCLRSVYVIICIFLTSLNSVLAFLHLSFSVDFICYGYLNFQVLGGLRTNGVCHQRVLQTMLLVTKIQHSIVILSNGSVVDIKAFVLHMVHILWQKFEIA